MKYFNQRKFPVRKVLLGISSPIYEDAQKYCQENKIRFTTLVNESLRAHLRQLREAQILIF